MDYIVIPRYIKSNCSFYYINMPQNYFTAISKNKSLLSISAIHIRLITIVNLFH
uniref:Uncharacterized protein n=1 Tax=Anguilla anguilla TaxID=7936 RepID=A0A0E9TUL7_ANGAN